jgi:tripartite-type tricarboxylate transporter receptor subunit TctC
MTNITRRAALAGLSAIGVAPAIAQTARPEGGITIVHGFTPGGNVDLTARLIAERLGARLGRQIVVEPKPGAGGTTAAAYVARATPDGATLAILPGGHAVSAAIYHKLPYRALEDFSWVSMLSDFPFVFVTYPDHPAKNLADFIRMAKEREGQLLCATPGNGTGQHLALELFTATAGIRVQVVPYRGSPPAAPDLLGKRLAPFIDKQTLVGVMV